MDHTNNNAEQFRLAYHKYLKLRSSAPQIVGRIAVNFFRRSFKNQGMMKNGSVEKWKDRSPGHPKNKENKKLLLDRGHLRDGIMIKSASPGKVVIGVDALVSPYASLMNDGGTIPVTLQMRKFFWAMYYQASGGMTYKVKATKVKGSKDKVHKLASGKKNKVLSADALFWRNMALTKQTSITIPARPFIYDSTDLVDEITKDLMKRIDKIMHH